MDHDERAPRGKRLSAPRSFEKGADVVSVPGTSGGTASRPGDRPTRSLELVSVDGRDYLVGGRCFECANLTKAAGDWRADDKPFSGGIFCAVTGTNRVVSGHVLGDRLLMYDVPRIDKVVASMCLTCEATDGFGCVRRRRRRSNPRGGAALSPAAARRRPRTRRAPRGGHHPERGAQARTHRRQQTRRRDRRKTSSGWRGLLTDGTLSTRFPRARLASRPRPTTTRGTVSARASRGGIRRTPRPSPRRTEPRSAGRLVGASRRRRVEDRLALLPPSHHKASSKGDGGGGGGAELVRTVHPHLPREGARDARIHDAALWARRCGLDGGSAAVVTAGSDGVVAVTGAPIRPTPSTTPRGGAWTRRRPGRRGWRCARGTRRR